MDGRKQYLALGAGRKECSVVLTCHDLVGRHHARSQTMQLLKGLVAAWLHGAAAVIQPPSAWLHGATAIIQSPSRAAPAA